MRKEQKVFLALLILAIILLTLLVIVYLKKRGEMKETGTSMPPSVSSSKIVWLSYGDSITDHGLWQPVILEHFNFRHIDAGISGSRVSGDWPYAFWHEERLAGIRSADPDLITIMGGTNDFYSDVPLGGEEQLSLPLEEKDKYTYLGAYSYLLESLFAWKEDLCIILITPPQNISKYVSDNRNALGLEIDRYAEACRVLASHYDLPLVDLFTLPYNADTLMADYSDGVHPNPGGAAKIADLVMDAFRAEGYEP